MDGFRCDALNFSMHDPALTDNPPVTTPGKRTRPFDFQHHDHNQSHPDILKFLTRLRQTTDSYPGDRFLVAEVGGEKANEEMKLYTEGQDRLHSAYGFLYLYADRLTTDLVDRGPAMWPGTEGEGWPSWTFSNHDAPRAVSRWVEGREPKAFAEMALLLLMCLRGNVFVYQGEELGLPQAEVPFERLVDPEAIVNWPDTLGRDGARTPMPWKADNGYAGFSEVEPWLPLDPRHRGLAAEAQERDPNSTLHLSRRLIALRHTHPALRVGSMTMLEGPGDILLFRRDGEGEILLCAFNLGHQPIDWTPPDCWSTRDESTWCGRPVRFAGADGGADPDRTGRMKRTGVMSPPRSPLGEWGGGAAPLCAVTEGFFVHSERTPPSLRYAPSHLPIAARRGGDEASPAARLPDDQVGGDAFGAPAALAGVVQQFGDHEPAGFHRVLGDGRQRRAAVAAEGHVIEADDGHVLGHALSGVQQGTHGPERDQIGGGDDAVEIQAASQHGIDRGLRAFDVEMGGQDQVGIDAQTRRLQRIGIAALTLHGLGRIEVAEIDDALAAQTRQVRRPRPRTGRPSPPSG